MLNLLRGIWQLRDPALIKYIGEKRFHLDTIEKIRQAYPKTKIDADITLVGFSLERLRMATAATIEKGSILAFGDSLNGLGTISIGESTWIGQYNNIRAGGADIIIGRHCLISQYCTLVATNHSHKKHAYIKEQNSNQTRKGVVLEDDVWLGAGVSIMPGVTVKQGAIVGANSVVTGNVPEYEVWAGAPARKIGERS